MKNIIKMAGVSVLFAGINAADAAQLSDYQGRSHIPDTKLNNCARQALIDQAHGSAGMLQDVFQENGATTYHFETRGPNGEESHVDVVEQGPSKNVTVYASGGGSTERKNALLNQMSLCI